MATFIVSILLIATCIGLLYAFTTKQPTKKNPDCKCTNCGCQKKN